MTTIRKKITFIIPFIILFATLGLLWRSLFYSTQNNLPSALIGEVVPNFQLPNLFKPQSTISQNDLRGQIVLLNVWATWCYACGLEQEMLMNITKRYHIPIYGLLYKDDAQMAKQWLQKNGNPYVMIGNDKNGDVAIDLGVYGTPETFVISPQGKILYRHVGVLDQKNWENVIYPLIKPYIPSAV